MNIDILRYTSLLEQVNGNVEHIERLQQLARATAGVDSGSVEKQMINEILTAGTFNPLTLDKLGSATLSNPESFARKCLELACPAFVMHDSTSLKVSWSQDLPINNNETELYSFVKRKGPVRWHTCPGHKRMYPQLLFSDFRRKHVTDLNEYYPFASSADQSVTQIDVATLITGVMRHGFEIGSINQIFHLCGYGTWNSTVVGLLIANLASSGSKGMITDMEDTLTCCASGPTIIAWLKVYSDKVRQHGSDCHGRAIPQREVCDRSYWMMCSSRYLATSDWEKERANRLKPITLARVVDYDFNNFVSDAMVELLKKVMANKRSAITSWADFVRDRHRIVSAGSTGGVKTNIGAQRLRAKKRLYLENVPTDEIISWLDSTPRIVASPSEKHELGKARAIYGSQPMDYLIMAYVLTPLESGTGVIEGAIYKTSAAELNSMTYSRSRQMAAGSYGAMIDYADFNAQHTLAVQSEVFGTIANLAALWEFHSDYVKAAMWCSRAMLFQYVDFKDGSQLFQVKQGLFSGMRGTAFCNTTLNWSYFAAAKIIVARMYPLLDPLPTSYHQGDDVWISSSSLMWNQLTYLVMSAAGLRFEPTKQLFACGIGEFLRVRYHPGGISGYLGRSVASLIIRPIQSGPELDLAAALAAKDEQIRVLCRRGLDARMAAALWKMLVRYRAEVGTGIDGVTISDTVLRSHRLYNGLGLCTPGDKPIWGLTLPRLRVIRPVSHYFTSGAAHMSSDVIKQMVGILKTDGNVAQLASHLKRTNYAEIVDEQDLANTKRSLQKAYEQWSKSTRGMSLTHKQKSRIKDDEYVTESDLQQLLMERVTKVYERGNRIIMGVKMDSKDEDHLFTKLVASTLAGTPFSDIFELLSYYEVDLLQGYQLLAKVSTNHVEANAMARRIGTIANVCSVEVTNHWLRFSSKLPTYAFHQLHPTLLSAIWDAVPDEIYEFAVNMLIHRPDDLRKIMLFFEDELIRVCSSNREMLILSQY